MTDMQHLARRHEAVTRRHFLRLGAAGAAAVSASSLWAADGGSSAAVERAVAKLPYLTPVEDFRLFGRGKPPPHTLPAEKLREVGLTRETWRLEVTGDENVLQVLQE